MADKSEQSNASKSHFCAHCGTENEKTGYACNRCGERLVEVDINSQSPLGLNSCARCGSANNTRATYCWVCGSEMHDAVRITPKPSPELRIPSATGPRTYRPDLNPVSPPANDSAPNPQTGAPDLRGPAPSSDSDLKIEFPISQQNPFGTPDASVENTSGTRGGEIPPEIKKWNWAAFLMPAVWGLFSGVPLTVVLFLPSIAQMVFGTSTAMTIVQFAVLGGASLFLGAKGNELAWRGKKWRSVEHFQAFQKQWGSWSVKLSIAFAVLLVLAQFSSGGA